MNWPEKDSPAWPILRLAVLGLVLALLLEMNYVHGFVANVDMKTIIEFLAAAVGIDGLKAFVTRDK